MSKQIVFVCELGYLSIRFESAHPFVGTLPALAAFGGEKVASRPFLWLKG